jgi:steroid delta-isomerase-like uncharacterized protein
MDLSTETTGMSSEVNAGDHNGQLLNMVMLEEGVGDNSADLVAFARELVEAWNSHDLERVTSYYAEDFRGVDVCLPKPQIGREAIKQSLYAFMRGFPDLHYELGEVVVTGDRVAIAWTSTGTHKGTIMNIPATGRSVCVCGSSFMTVKDGKVTEALRIWDLASMLRSLGLLPDL